MPPKDLTGKIEDYGLEDIGDFSVPAELKQYKCTTEIGNYSSFLLLFLLFVKTCCERLRD